MLSLGVRTSGAKEPHPDPPAPLRLGFAANQSSASASCCLNFPHRRLPPSSPSSSSSSSRCPGNQRPRRLAPGDSPVTKAAFTVPVGWGHPCAPSSPHNAGRRVLGVACHPGGMAGGSQPPRVLPSSSSSTGQGTGFTGSPGQWGGGGRRRGQGLFLVALAGWRPGQPSLKPLAHPGGSPSVIQPEGSCPSKPGEAVGIPAGQEVEPVSAKQLALLLFSHPALPNPRNSLLQARKQFPHIGISVNLGGWKTLS